MFVVSRYISAFGSGRALVDDAAPTTQWQLALDSALNFIIIESSSAAVEVVVLLALIYFSTSVSRQKLAFLLNIVALFLGLIMAIDGVYLEVCLEHITTTLSQMS